MLEAGQSRAGLGRAERGWAEQSGAGQLPCPTWLMSPALEDVATRARLREASSASPQGRRRNCPCTNTDLTQVFLAPVEDLHQKSWALLHSSCQV